LPLWIWTQQGVRSFYGVGDGEANAKHVSSADKWLVMGTGFDIEHGTAAYASTRLRKFDFWVVNDQQRLITSCALWAEFSSSESSSLHCLVSW